VQFFLFVSLDLKFCHLDLSLCHAGEGWRALLWQKHSPTTLREESFAVRLNRKIFTFLRKKTLTVGFKSILWNKLLRLTIFKRLFFKAF